MYWVKDIVAQVNQVAMQCVSCFTKVVSIAHVKRMQSHQILYFVRY